MHIKKAQGCVTRLWFSQPISTSYGLVRKYITHAALAVIPGTGLGGHARMTCSPSLLLWRRAERHVVFFSCGDSASSSDRPSAQRSPGLNCAQKTFHVMLRACSSHVQEELAPWKKAIGSSLCLVQLGISARGGILISAYTKKYTKGDTIKKFFA